MLARDGYSVTPTAGRTSTGSINMVQSCIR